MQNEIYADPKGLIDIVVMTVIGGKLHVMLKGREHPPFQGAPALLGGFVDVERDRTLDDTVERILSDKAGLNRLYFEQLYTFGSRDRDPSRGWTITVAYIALVPSAVIDKQTESHALSLSPVDELPELPFDHAAIVETARERLQGKGAYSVLPAHLIDPPLTLPRLHRVYCDVLGEDMNYANFRRKLLETGLFIQSGMHKPERGKKVQTFKLAPGASTMTRRL